VDLKDALREDYPNLITPDWVIKQGACFSDRSHIFMGGWSQGIALNRENTLKAGKQGLSIDWLAATFLNPKTLLEYEEKRSPVDLETRQLIEVDLKEYRRLRSLSPKSPDEWQNDPALSEYRRKRSLIKKESQYKKALVLADIVFGKEE